MLRTLFISALFATTAAGCYSEEPDVTYAGGGSVGYGAPGLVEVSPGIEVIADYDYPVFYSDGFYWRYDGGIWYQSGYYNRGWGVAYNVPYGVRGIRNPGGYAHFNAGVRDHRSGYVGSGYARGNYGRGYSGGAGFRDHRSSGGAISRPAPAARSGGSGGRGGFHGSGGRGHR